MRAVHTIIGLVAGAAASHLALATSGFEDAEIVSSSNGNAICIQGNLKNPVYASTTGNHIFPIPESAFTNQSVVTETFVELLMSGGTLQERTTSQS
ncbi:hypothetical protein POJ06DRAFT_245336 [Lipomyces tetrasporus]|uniref:Uncharacterized protein n=1 Tax=Lipomyces tetrasporus TaxID=54092 RepID=A0AAD7QWL7_9ASCO|nr:uncharacterized protein POJ06DRAFT_245336 [Lipomyces tetrasporus]KAJ8102678.1 hypothetical protein POJ06DRAFT_245336 [Lipomyces tetrasporus]